MKRVSHPVHHRTRRQQVPREECTRERQLLVAAVLGLVLIMGWSYWSTVTGLFRGWQSHDYSAGQLVPLVAVVFIWRERKTLRQAEVLPCWWGIAAVLLAQAARTFGLLFMFDSVRGYSLVLCVAGLVLLVAGWEVLRRVAWVLVFLFLMFPLPGRVHNVIAGPLQEMATSGAVFCLEAFGTRVTQQGNVVVLDDNVPMAVAEACSGLRMLTAFVIVAAFIAYMVKRSRPRKAVLLLSSIPVAVVCNILRIFLTALIMLHVSVELGEKFFHDFAGLVMMPAAVSLLFGELWLMDRLFERSEGLSTHQRKIVRAKTRKQAGARATRI